MESCTFSLSEESAESNSIISLVFSVYSFSSPGMVDNIMVEQGLWSMLIGAKIPTYKKGLVVSLSHDVCSVDGSF